MAVQRDLSFPGEAEELESILRDYARAFGGLLSKRRGYVLSMGASLATNPNEVKWSARASLDGGTLRIAAAAAAAFPWSRPRVARLVVFMETNLGGGAAAKFSEPASRRPFRAVGPGAGGGCAALASWAAQTC